MFIVVFIDVYFFSILLGVDGKCRIVICWFCIMDYWFVSERFVFCIVYFDWFEYVFIIEVIVDYYYWFYVVKNNVIYVGSNECVFFVVFSGISILLVS